MIESQRSKRCATQEFELRRRGQGTRFETCLVALLVCLHGKAQLDQDFEGQEIFHASFEKLFAIEIPTSRKGREKWGTLNLSG